MNIVVNQHLGPHLREADMSAVPPWTGLVHRIGVVLVAQHAVPTGKGHLPPFDPDAKWTIAAREWGRHSQDEALFPDAVAQEGHKDESVDPLSAQSSTDELVLGVKRARIAARLIHDDYDKYNQAVRDALKADGLDAEFANERLGVRYSPAIVLDFPRFTVRLKGIRLASGRLCVTVCLHESHSKLWVRFSEAEEQEPGRASQEHVARFLEQTNHWFDTLSSIVKAIYKEHIETALATSGEPTPKIDLGVRHRIELVSADTQLPRLRDLATSIVEQSDPYREDTARRRRTTRGNGEMRPSDGG